MGRILWNTFDRLTAAQVQQMADQSVMRFADAAARSTAIPSPVAGMIVWLDDPGKHQGYDGTSWEDFPFDTSAAMLRRGAPLDIGSTYVSGLTLTTSWTQVTAGLSDAVLIYAVTAVGSGAGELEIGTGASAAEVVRATGVSIRSTSDTARAGASFLPWGVWVPASTRIAVRRAAGSSTSSQVLLHWVEAPTGEQVQAGAIRNVTFTTSTSPATWQQVAATPPLSGGVEVVRVVLEGTGSNAARPWGVEVGFGAAAAEVAASGAVSYIDGFEFSPAGHPPIQWPTSTRMALRKNFTNTLGSTTFNVHWRESLA